MIMADITAGVATRVRRCPPLQQVYDVPPAGTPEVPCVVVGFPQVTTYHTDAAHQLTLLAIELKLLLGRGDAEGAYRQLAELLSTEGPNSLVRALEDAGAPDPVPWHRIKVLGSDEPRDEGDNISVRLGLEMHA